MVRKLICIYNSDLYIFCPVFVYRQIFSERENTLFHIQASSKMHGMTCLWRCPALIRICFLWRLTYDALVALFKSNSRNIVILISLGSLMQVGGRVQSRWDLIYTALRGGFKSSLDIRVTILIHWQPRKYNNSSVLHNYLGLTALSHFTVTQFHSRNGHMGAEFATKNMEFIWCFKSISNSPLQEAILTYNTAHAKKWDFTALNLLCTEVSYVGKTWQLYDWLVLTGVLQNIKKIN